MWLWFVNTFQAMHAYIIIELIEDNLISIKIWNIEKCNKTKR